MSLKFFAKALVVIDRSELIRKIVITWCTADLRVIHLSHDSLNEFLPAVPKCNFQDHRRFPKEKTEVGRLRVKFAYKKDDFSC